MSFSPSGRSSRNRLEIRVGKFPTCRLTEDQVAIAIAQPTPGGVQNRVINAMQLARGHQVGGNELSDMVVEENCKGLRDVQLNQPGQRRPATIRLSIAGVVLLLGAVF